MTPVEGFNLIEQPWIVALGRDGRQREVSILEVFNEAAQFTSLGGEVATQGFAITRTLLAFLHRALDGPATRDEWADLWDAPTLPCERIASYAKRVRDRFDLFDPEVPFFQVPGLHTAKDEVFGLERIVADVPNGEPFFTTRSARDLSMISAAEAARWLIHVHAFDPSGIKSGAVGDPEVKNGKGYPIGPGWSGQLGAVLLQGTNLRETLLLNLIGRDGSSYVRIGVDGDVPPWERDPDGPTWRQRPPRGAVDLYTWQTRRVRLVGNRSGVSGVVLANGDKITPQNLHTVEPHSAWQHSDAQSKKAKSTVYMPRTHLPERSVWRGIAALLPSTAGRHTNSAQPQRFLAPGVLQWVSDLAAQGLLEETYKPGIRIYGAVYGAQQATIAEIVDDELALPLKLLREDTPAAGTTAVEAVTDAEHVATEVWKLGQNIAQAAGADPKDTAPGDRAREDFYARLDGPYQQWLSALSTQADLADARSVWRSILRAAARAVADQFITGAPPAAWVGRVVRDHLINVAQAEAWFVSGLRRTLPPVGKDI
jgi:CRISPR system Cascade subunit CasA